MFLRHTIHEGPVTLREITGDDRPGLDHNDILKLRFGMWKTFEATWVSVNTLLTRLDLLLHQIDGAWRMARQEAEFKDKQKKEDQRAEREARKDHRFLHPKKKAKCKRCNI